MTREASKALYDLFNTTGEHLLRNDRRALGQLTTYKRARNGLKFLFGVVKQHHPNYNSTRCRKIQFGPKFAPEEQSIFEFAHELQNWKLEQSQPFTPLELSKYFVEQMDARFETGKGLVLVDIQSLEDTHGRDFDLTNHTHLALPELADHLLRRTTTDPAKINLYSGVLQSVVRPAAHKTFDRRKKENYSPSRRRSNSPTGSYHARGRSSTPTSRYSKENRNNSRDSSRSYSKPRYTPREPELCSICKQRDTRCKDGCINVGIALSIKDYMAKYPHADRDKLLKEYEANQQAFIKKMKENYHKRRQARVNKIQLVEKLRENVSLSSEDIKAFGDNFVATQEAQDPDIFFGAIDRCLDDEKEPMLA